MGAAHNPVAVVVLVDSLLELVLLLLEQPTQSQLGRGAMALLQVRELRKMVEIVLLLVLDLLLLLRLGEVKEVSIMAVQGAMVVPEVVVL